MWPLAVKSHHNRTVTHDTRGKGLDIQIVNLRFFCQVYRVVIRSQVKPWVNQKFGRTHLTELVKVV